MEHTKELLEKYLLHDLLGKYRYCKVTQIVLFSDKYCLNYFTNIDCSSKYSEPTEFHYVTRAPLTVDEDSGLKLAISEYVIPVQEVIDLVCKAEVTGHWVYDGKNITLDNVFSSYPKYIPESDPTGCQYETYVPLEYGIYGSNFMGNYYIFELISRKTVLEKILSPKIVLNIKDFLLSHKINYRLDKLFDRIGNIIVKMPIEVLLATPIKLGMYGIELQFSLQRPFEHNRYCLSVTQTHDGLILENGINTDFDCTIVKINPNQCKTTISITDQANSLTLYYGSFDYSLFSNYGAQITPPSLVAQIPEKRILHINGNDETIELPNIQMAGPIYLFEEMSMASKRKIALDDEWFQKRGYLKAYSTQEHEKALHDIIDIVSNNLPWDLDELWVIDPYLKVEDLADTVLRARIKNIFIKALCDFSAIDGNPETKLKQGNGHNFSSFQSHESQLLHSILGDNTDIKIEYRSIRMGYGHSFHDRYIIMNYKLNRVRVWALGSSINSIGKKHSILQIVNTPEIILSEFEQIWRETDRDECRIFSNLDI